MVFLAQVNYLDFHHQYHVLFVVLDGLLKQCFNLLRELPRVLVAQPPDVFPCNSLVTTHRF